jgi:hypothetical protein
VYTRARGCAGCAVSTAAPLVAMPAESGASPAPLRRRPRAAPSGAETSTAAVYAARRTRRGAAASSARRAAQWHGGRLAPLQATSMRAGAGAPAPRPAARCGCTPGEGGARCPDDVSTRGRHLLGRTCVAFAPKTLFWFAVCID